ncbi:MAG: MerR family transcriptional regulator [Flavobacteriales bacterium]|nr:MAG: MerR family transcriptional regulator [Flavobacteriales bacterium]
MLNGIKSTFSIKDMENFSGIKQHTIRIWEKRYNLLEPERTDCNIRFYDARNFEKLLNVSLLYHNGYKISKIARLSEEELIQKTDELGRQCFVDNSYHHYFKLAMLSFDVDLFNKTYQKLLALKPLSHIFLKILFPFLNKVGHLWQTQSIKPSHEHFVSYLILQKLQIAIAEAQKNIKPANKVYVLYLPEGETHELGLFYIQYALLEQGENCIYLGSNLSMECLQPVSENFAAIHFVSYCTIKLADVDAYLKKFKKTYLHHSKHKLHFISPVKEMGNQFKNESITGYTSLNEFLETLN